MRSLKTSVVIPVKDDESVYNCIESILPQLGKDRELLVVCDIKSEKEFYSRLEKYCNNLKNKGVCFMTPNKPGAAANRTLGMRMSSGKNILFIDSDCVAEKRWVKEMEFQLSRFDIVEGTVLYASNIRTPLDKVVENKGQLYRFLTANLGITNKVADKCEFDTSYVLFREDTDFGFQAIKTGFKHGFSTSGIVIHKRQKYTIKKFIFERKRYFTEARFFDKWKNDNTLLKHEVKRIGRFLYPQELAFIGLMVLLLPFSLCWAFAAYLIPGIIYLLRQFNQGFQFDFKETIIVMLLLSATMIIKRISIWRGALHYKVFVI